MSGCYRFTVSGRVQGVFFRASTRDIAQQLELKGWVRNLCSGDVELVACGEKSRLELLEKWLWQGPKFSKVNSVKSEIFSAAVGEALGDFEIRQNGQ